MWLKETKQMRGQIFQLRTHLQVFLIASNLHSNHSIHLFWLFTSEPTKF